MKSFLLLLVLGVFAYRVSAEPFDPGNSPFYFNQISGTQMVTELEFLPQTGRIHDDRYGWSETYWPSHLGGIAYRWNHPNPNPFRYRLLKKEEVQKLSPDEMSQLSPAELYDIALGDYSYTLTRFALNKFSPRDLWWEGICHGWAQAAVNYPEPDKVTLLNPDGIKVSLGASDVKGLLSMHEAFNFGGKFAFNGKRCKALGKVPGEAGSRDRQVDPPSEEMAEAPECRDVNAGAFHLVLTNLVGIHGRGFVADVDRFNDVWNQPVTHYESELVGAGEAPVSLSEVGVYKTIQVKTRMYYGEELKFHTPELEAEGVLGFVSKFPVTGTDRQVFKFKDYEYLLELNQAGEIIGGSWLSATRPDFIWIYGRSKNFKNTPAPLAGLTKIYRPVRR